MSDLDRFVAEENVKLFRSILEQDLSPEKKDIILKLLEEAEEALRKINASSSIPR